MPLDPATVLHLAAQCAPAVAPPTLLAVAQVESGLDPLAIGVNGRPGASLRASSPDEAASIARGLVRAGRDFDVGLAQINVRNLPALGLSLQAAFEPCRNLAAAGAILSDGYRRGVELVGPGQPALRVALSFYNTGKPYAGFGNGYVARVLTRYPAPGEPAPSRAIPSASAPTAAPWDVFGRAGGPPIRAFVFVSQGATP